ncbi:MAG: TIGR03757 family integrating conjugative element protein [Planctomycetaceae bacterium]|nr:TIGR03757 family integrating conjugative element protein [Planctomycetaceae bacterium]
MTIFMKSLTVCILMGWALPAQAQFEPYPHTIMVITSDELEITGLPLVSTESPQIDIYSLDAVATVESRLSVLLPPDEEQAMAVMQQRIEQIGKARLEADLVKAYKALTTAMSYDLDRYPAMIFDGEVVIYGITDVSLATQIYQDWLVEEYEGDNSE